MSERSTPETDAAWQQGFSEVHRYMTSHRLERQRDEVREERDIARLERDEAIADYQRVYKERDEAVAECKSLWSLLNANKLRAYKAERERDQAREALSAAKHYLTKERDEALSQIVQAECRAERFCQERDEAIADRDILRINAQKEDVHHDRLLNELERVYKERDDLREKVAKLQEIISQCLDCTQILSAAKEGEQ